MQEKHLPEIRLSYHFGTAVKIKISSATSAYSFVKTLYTATDVGYIEYAYALFVNRANVTIGWQKLSQGGTCGTIVDPKVLFVAALKCGAAGIILSHNHPSGNLKPSTEDLRLTKNLKEIGHLLQITVLDHLILTTEGFYSFADNGDI